MDDENRPAVYNKQSEVIETTLKKSVDQPGSQTVKVMAFCSSNDMKAQYVKSESIFLKPKPVEAEGYEAIVEEVSAEGEEESDEDKGTITEQLDTMLEDAKISVIIAKCFISNDSFKSIKDRLHSTQITWSQIIAVRQAIFNYVSRFQGITEDSAKPFALPLDLHSPYPAYERI